MTTAAADSGSAAGPLSDVRVLELAQVIAVPSCGALLADLGASVIKVEPPHGDAYRLNQRTHVRTEGRSFPVFNRGKRGICLDLGHPESRTVLERLVRSVDVVLVSFKPSDLQRYGIDYPRLRALHPKLIYLENTPYGPRGPYGQEGGYDVVVQGMSGLGAISGASEHGAPRFVRPAYADVATGFVAALGVVAALRHRDRSGEGQRVETSLLATALALASGVSTRFDDLDGDRWEALSAEIGQLREAGAPFEAQQARYFERFQVYGEGNIYFRHYRTRDGFISVGCLSPALNERLRLALGLEDPRRRSGFDAGSAAGRAELDSFVQRAEQLVAARTSAHWLALLREHGVPCGPFSFPHEIFDDAQIRANEYMVETEHPELGRYRSSGSPLRMDATPVRVGGSSPTLDADTDAVLREIGLSEVERIKLRELGVIGRKIPPARTSSGGS